MKKWIARLIDHWLEQRNLCILYRIDGSAIGDMVTATAWMRRAHERYGLRFVVITKYPALFEHNPLVERNIHFGRLGGLGKPVVKWILRNIELPRILSYAYNGSKPASREAFLAAHSRHVSLTQILSEHSSFPVSYDSLRPEFYFDVEEEAAFEKKFGLDVHNYAVIKPSAFKGWSPNKEWDFERFQTVVDALPEFNWVQVGAKEDPALQGVQDLRDKTDLRELALLIRGSRAVLSTEGLPNHISAAFGTPSFVLFSGIHYPDIARYANTRVIAREPATECTPCWLTTPCPIPGRPCILDIPAKQVIDALRESPPLPRR